MLRTLKGAVLRAATGLGVSARVARSSWRTTRLLILGYHGISLCDEHTWEPALYMHPAVLRRRFQALRDGGFQVLPLDEGIRRVGEGTLPPKAVCITFDDGTVDFAQSAVPLLEEFGFPATLYLTTFYSLAQRPVFNTMCRYLLWLGRGRVLDSSLVGINGTIRLDSPDGRSEAFATLRRGAAAGRYNWRAKDDLLGAIAAQLGIDYEALCAKRSLFLLSPDEVAKLPSPLVDVQLHTHRHRLPLEHDRFLRELEENGEIIRSLRPATKVRHFCYPSGVTNPRVLPWLREAGVVSATTCALGLASRRSDVLMLPRLIDMHHLPDEVFEGWLDGLAALLPRRPVPRAILD